MASGRILLTGASGFVGKAVLRRLLTRGYGVNALVNRRPLDAAGGDVRQVRGSMWDAAALDDAAGGCSAAIHLVGIIAEQGENTFQRVHVEGTASVLAACARAGIRRYVHMSALGTRENAASEYHRTKWAAEQLVRGSALEWTIFRASMIHGSEGEFSKMLAAWARGQASPYLFMPYFGRGLLGLGGAGLLQPVYVEDVARAFVEALDRPETVRKVYDLAGAQKLTWPELHRLGAKAIVGRHRPVVAMPAWFAKALTHVAPASLLPFNRDQVVMSQEDSTGDMEPFARDFGWRPGGFGQTLSGYADGMRPSSPQ